MTRASGALLACAWMLASALASPAAWMTTAMISVVVGPARAAGDVHPSEAALRRRVQRFYVFSYLNRHGEMWEMFSAALQEQLGSDRKEYVRSARAQGYELYSSQIEGLSMDGDVGVVSVRIQVQVAGATAITWRRHRMIWRLEDGQWAYSGSADVSSEDPEDQAQLQAVPGTNLGPFTGEELLPPREAVSTSPPATPAPASKAASSAPTPAISTTAERWDLVAIPPAGTELPTPTPKAPLPSAEDAPTHDASVTSSPMPAPAPPPASSALPTPAQPAPIVKQDPVPGGEGSLAELVRKAAHGNLVRRLRALDAIRDVRDRSLVPLIVQSIGDAPPDSVAVFLDKLAEFGAVKELAIIRAQLGSTSPLVRSAAVRAVGDLGGPADQPAVEALLSDSFREVRVDALSALGRLGGAPGPALARVLADPARASDELAAAASAAGLARAVECEDELLALMARLLPAVASVAAIEACGRLGTGGCVSALRSLLAGNDRLEARGMSLPLRLLAARALAGSGADGGGLALANALVEFPDSSSSGDADIVASTGELRGLLVLLGHPRSMVRRRAAELTGRAVDGLQDRELALAALTSARNAEADDDTLLAMQAALERLRAMDQPDAPPAALR